MGSSLLFVFVLQAIKIRKAFFFHIVRSAKYLGDDDICQHLYETTWLYPVEVTEGKHSVQPGTVT